MAFPLAKIHASLVKWVPGQPPVRRPLRFRPLPPRPILPIAPTLFMSTQDSPAVSNPANPLLRLIQSL